MGIGAVLGGLTAAAGLFQSFRKDKSAKKVYIPPRPMGWALSAGDLDYERMIGEELPETPEHFGQYLDTLLMRNEEFSRARDLMAKHLQGGRFAQLFSSTTTGKTPYAHSQWYENKAKPIEDSTKDRWEWTGGP